MSDTHAQTAKAQAAAQTGQPAVPPGHPEAEREVAPSAKPKKPMTTVVTIGLAALIIVIAVVFLAL